MISPILFFEKKIVQTKIVKVVSPSRHVYQRAIDALRAIKDRKAEANLVHLTNTPKVRGRSIGRRRWSERQALGHTRRTQAGRYRKGGLSKETSRQCNEKKRIAASPLTPLFLPIQQPSLGFRGQADQTNGRRDVSLI